MRREQARGPRRFPGMQPNTAQRRASRPVRFAALAFAAVAVIAGTVLWTGAPSAPEGMATAAAPATQQPHAAAAGHERTVAGAARAAGCWGAGPGASFRHHFTGRFDYALQNRDAVQHQAGGMRVEATQTTLVLARRNGEILTQMTLGDLAITAADAKKLDGDPQALRFAAAAATPVLARLGDDGHVLGYRFAAALDGEQRNFLRGILAPFAFTVPTTLRSTWDAVEADTTGTYEAHYEQQVDDAQVNVQRTKVRYTAMAGNGAAADHQLRGRATATFGLDIAWLQAATVDESLATDLPLPGMRVEYSCRAELKLVAAELAALPAGVVEMWNGGWEPATGKDEVLPDYATEAAQRDWAQQLEGVDLDQVLAALAALTASEKLDTNALDHAFQQLQWLVKLRPGTAATIAERVLDGQLTGDAARVALSSLAAAGTDQAQQILAAIRANPAASAEVHDAATICLIQLARPNGEIVAGLATEAAAAGQNAMLVLGALAPRAQGTLGDGRTAMTTLAGMEQAAADRGELANWLRAMGNAGTPETMAAASRYLDNPAADVRAAAAAALRRVADPDAATALAGLAAGDEDADVRRQAVEALSQRREPAARESLRNSALSDVDSSVRSAAITALGLDVHDAGNRATLEQVAMQDSVPELRTMAQQLLARR
jgi:hypothetical protein